MTIEVTQPTAQYTPGSECAHVQFSWRIAADGATPAGGWHRESYSPTQAQLAARAATAASAFALGYWSDAEVRADVLNRMATEYGFTSVRFLAETAS